MADLLANLIVSGLLFSAVFLLIWSLFRYPVPPEPPVHRRMAIAMGAGGRATMFEQPVLAPIMSLMLGLAKRLSSPGLRRMVRQNLDACGNPSSYSVDEYLSLCLLSGLVLPAAIAVVSLVLGHLNPALVMLMTVIGFAIPLYQLHSSATARIARIAKQLPYTLDLIALMMAAGSTFNEAIATLIRDEPDDDFNRELGLVLSEMEFGTIRSQALTNMSQRIPLDTLRSIVGAVNQAEALGTPLSVILKTQASMLRMHRSVRAEKLSASASLRILIPSMLILLAVVLTVFGPVLINWWVQGSLW